MLCLMIYRMTCTVSFYHVCVGYSRGFHILEIRTELSGRLGQKQLSPEKKQPKPAFSLNLVLTGCDVCSDRGGQDWWDSLYTASSHGLLRHICITGLFIPLWKLRALVWVGCSWSIYFACDLELQGEMHFRMRSVNFVSGEYLSSVVALSGVPFSVPYKNWQ